MRRHLKSITEKRSEQVKYDDIDLRTYGHYLFQDMAPEYFLVGQVSDEYLQRYDLDQKEICGQKVVVGKKDEQVSYTQNGIKLFIACLDMARSNQDFKYQINLFQPLREFMQPEHSNPVSDSLVLPGEIAETTQLVAHGSLLEVLRDHGIDLYAWTKGRKGFVEIEHDSVIEMAKVLENVGSEQGEKRHVG